MIYRTANVNGRPITKLDVNYFDSKNQMKVEAPELRYQEKNVKSRPITKIDVNTKTFKKN